MQFSSKNYTVLGSRYARSLRLKQVFSSCRAECREKMGVLDLPAAKAALSTVIPGFTAAVRPPLQAVTREQQQTLENFVKETSA